MAVEAVVMEVVAAEEADMDVAVGETAEVAMEAEAVEVKLRFYLNPVLPISTSTLFLYLPGDIQNRKSVQDLTELRILIREIRGSNGV